MYSYPTMKKPHFFPGAIVYHKYLPRVPLVVVSGPERSPLGETVYMVQMPNGKQAFRAAKRAARRAS